MTVAHRADEGTETPIVSPMHAAALVETLLAEHGRFDAATRNTRFSAFAALIAEARDYYKHVASGRRRRRAFEDPPRPGSVRERGGSKRARDDGARDDA